MGTMLFLLSILTTIVLRGSRSQHNPFLDIYKTIVYFFICIQLSSTFLLFLGWLSPLSAIATLFLPPVILNRKLSQTIGLFPFAAFLPCFVLYVFLAAPPPFLRDSLTYHLSLSKLYAISGEFTKTDEVIFSYFPQGWQAIIALFQSCSSVEPIQISPRFLAAVISLGTGFGITGILKANKTPLHWAKLAGIMFLLIPTNLEFGTSCYVQAWLVSLSLYTIYCFLKEESALKIGLLVGLLCSLKYSALFWVALLGIPYLRRREYQFFLGVIFTGSSFYLRNLWLKHNPIFPLGYTLFGGEGWDEWRALAYSITLQNYGMGRDPLDFLLLPIRIFVTQDMYRHFEGALGIGLGLLCLGALFSIKLMNRRELFLLYFIAGWTLLWSIQVQQIRFLMPIVPLIFLLSVPILSHRISFLLPLSFVMSIAGNTDAYTQLWKSQKSLYFYQAGKEAYLERQLPENYPAYRYLNQNKADKIWLVWMREYHYYIDHPVRIDSIMGAYRFENLLYQSKEHPEVFLSTLQQDGISHIVINWRFFLYDGNADRLGEGQTEELRRSFLSMVHSKHLHVEKEFGPVIVYSVSSSSSSSSK